MPRRVRSPSLTRCCSLQCTISFTPERLDKGDRLGISQASLKASAATLHCQLPVPACVVQWSPETLPSFLPYHGSQREQDADSPQQSAFVQKVGCYSVSCSLLLWFQGTTEETKVLRLASTLPPLLGCTFPEHPIFITFLACAYPTLP